MSTVLFSQAQESALREDSQPIEGKSNQLWLKLELASRVTNTPKSSEREPQGLQ